MSKNIQLNRLMRYSASQVSYFRRYPNKEKTNKSPEGEAWREVQLQGVGCRYLKGSSMLRDTSFSYTIDEVTDKAFIWYKMSVKDFDDDRYLYRWFLYVLGVAALFSIGDKVLNRTKATGICADEELDFKANKPLAYFIKVGEAWYRITLINRNGMLDYIRAKAKASQNFKTAEEFDKQSSKDVFNLLGEVQLCHSLK